MSEHEDLDRIFVSYSGADRAYVDKLVEELDRQSSQLELWHMFGPRPGTRGYPVDIDDALEWCNRFLLVYSPNTPKAVSGGCRTEVTLAKEAGIDGIVVLLHGETIFDMRGEFRYFAAGLTPVVWSGAQQVARDVLTRLDRLPAHTRTPRQKEFRRVLIVEGPEEGIAVAAGLRALQVELADVDLDVLRVFGGQRPGQVRMSVRESGTTVGARLVTTRHPDPGDVMVREAARLLRLDPRDIRVHLLPAHGLGTPDTGLHYVLVCPPQFPTPRYESPL